MTERDPHPAILLSLRKAQKLISGEDKWSWKHVSLIYNPIGSLSHWGLCLWMSLCPPKGGNSKDAHYLLLLLSPSFTGDKHVGFLAAPVPTFCFCMPPVPIASQ